MHQPLSVGRGQPLRGLQADAHDLLQAGWTFPVELLLERDTVHELHHQVRGPVCFFDGMDGNDMLVTDGGDSTMRKSRAAPEPSA